MVFIKTSHSIGHLKLQDRWKVLWSLVTGNVSVTAIQLCSSIKVTFKKAKEWPLQCRECDNTAVDPLLPIPVLCGNRLNVTHLKSSKTWSQKPLQLPDLALLPTAVCIYRQQLGEKQEHMGGFGYLDKTWTWFCCSSVFLVLLLLKKISLQNWRSGCIHSLNNIWGGFGSC